MRKPWLLPDSHEDAFLDRYDQLMRAALHLTGHDRARAEDLLHTVFVQFSLVRIPGQGERDSGVNAKSVPG
jgi:hypothetical protein